MQLWKWLARVETVISLWKALPLPSAAMIGTVWAALASQWSWPIALLSAFASFALVAWGGYALILINERRGGIAQAVRTPDNPATIEDVQTAVTVYDTQGGASVEVRLIAVNFMPTNLDMELSARLDTIVENIRTEVRETIPALSTKPVFLRSSISREQKTTLIEKQHIKINAWVTLADRQPKGYTIVDVPVRDGGHLS